MIKIINGTFGYRQGNRVIPLTAKSGAVELPKELESRLVKEGVAEYVSMAKAQPDKEEKPSKPKYDREFLISRYKELELPGNPVQLKNEVLAEAISKAEEEKGKEEENSQSENKNEGEGLSSLGEGNEGEGNSQPQIETTEVGQVNPEGLIPVDGQDADTSQSGEPSTAGDTNDNPATGEDGTQTDNDNGNGNGTDDAPVLTEDDGIVE